jgi:hypothetical protein
MATAESSSFSKKVRLPCPNGGWLIRLGNEAMNSELTTNDDSAEVRQMISAWTDSLLRQRSRPTRVPPRGEWQFASATVQEAQRSFVCREMNSAN